MKTVLGIIMLVLIIYAFVRSDDLIDFEKSMIADLANLFMR